MFGWTADEADQLRDPRRLRRCRRQHDRHRGCLFGLGSGTSGRRKRDGHRPLAETRSGQARQGRDRDQGRLSRWEIVDGEYVAASNPRSSRAPAKRRFGGSGSTRSTFIISTRTIRRCRCADSLGAMDALVKAGKVRAIGLSQYSAERLDEAMQDADTARPDAPCALQTWYNLWSATSSRGRCATRRLRNGLGIIPFYGLANGFLTGKYRSNARSRQKHARRSGCRLSRRQGRARARRARSGQRRDRRAARRGRSCLDQRAAAESPRRWPARPASSSCASSTRVDGPAS